MAESGYGCHSSWIAAEGTSGFLPEIGSDIQLRLRPVTHPQALWLGRLFMTCGAEVVFFTSLRVQMFRIFLVIFVVASQTSPGSGYKVFFPFHFSALSLHRAISSMPHM